MLTMSVAPPSARNATASHSEWVSPKPIMVTPHAATATITATPCRRIRENQPENSPHSTAPSGMAANSQPSASPPPGGSPKVRSAISGNSALGMPATMAITSSSSEASSTVCVAM